MNRIFRLVWNRALRLLQVSSELTRAPRSQATGTGTGTVRRNGLALACRLALGAVVMSALWFAPPLAAQSISHATGGGGDTYQGHGGGNGGDAGQPGVDGSSGLGGAGGSSSGSDGGNGAGTGGGGGGAHGGVLTDDPVANMTGGNGGAGGLGNGVVGGGGGGAGGDGALVEQDVNLTVDQGTLLQGGDGGFGDSGGGGGGGAGLYVSGANVTANLRVDGAIAGGAGGASVAFGGGGGGAGVVVADGATLQLDLGGRITGGSLSLALGSANGTSGDGIVAGVDSRVDVTLGAGAEIAGGDGLGLGDGGAGLRLSGGGTVNNRGGTIAGGSDQGSGSSGDASIPEGGRGSGGAAGGTSAPASSAAGAGIIGQNLTISNAGTIAGGADFYDGRASAIIFTGGSNMLWLQPGSVIEGVVDATAGVSDALVLGDAAGGTFDFDIGQIGPTGQYRGFEQYWAGGTGIVTLSGSTTEVTPWTSDSDAVLSVASDASLGDLSGDLLLRYGGTLQVTGTANETTARNIGIYQRGYIDVADAGNHFTLTGAVTDFDPAIGGGGVTPSSLTKRGDGTLTLAGSNTYSGGTVVEGGTLEIAAGSTAGSLDGNNGAAGGVVQLFGGTTLHNAGTTGTIQLASQQGQPPGTELLPVTVTNTGSVVGDDLGAGIVLLNGDVSNSGSISVANPTTPFGGGVAILGEGSIDNTGSISAPQGAALMLGTPTTTSMPITDGIEVSNRQGGSIQGSVGVFVNQIVTLVSGGAATYSSRPISIINDGGTISGSAMGIELIAGGSIDNRAGSIIETTGTVAGACTPFLPGNGSAGGSCAIFAPDVADLGGLPVGFVVPPTVLSNAGSIVGNVHLSDGLANAVTLVAGGSIDGNLEIGSSTDASLALQGGAGTTQAYSQAVTGDTTFAGSLTKSGAGTWVLDNAALAGATGTTQLQGGSLIVGGAAGDGGALGGNVGVAADTTLGGHGAIAGDVAVAQGGILAPGNSIGNLTIGGDLSLAAGSVLDFEFGQPGINDQTAGVGDSIDVGGELHFDGVATLNLADDGQMGAGLYRLFDYGSLSTNGCSFGSAATCLQVGDFPQGTALGDFSIVDNTAGKQINLYSTAGLTLNIWAPASASAPGGDGTWSTTSVTWTDPEGHGPSNMSPQPGFAIFQGSPGTVTVDNGAGDVSATGMQFAVDGYTLTGDSLTLVQDAGGDAPVIRVSDGHAGSAAMKATIDAVLAGTDGLVKADYGTLVLTGANTFSGGVTVNGGTLSVAGDGNLGDAANGLTLDGGVLEVTGTSFTATPRTIALGDAGGGFAIDEAGTTFTVASSLGGAGALVKSGAGSLVLTGANTYAGGTTIAAGTLQVGDGGTAGSITGNVANSGGLVFDRSDAVGFGGVVSGNGSLTQQGSGTLTLTGANTYGGGTTIAAGTLQVGNGGTAGSITGDVANSGMLVFDRSDDVDFGGVVSGSGALTQQGNGSLTLTGSNTYTGGTTIAAGTLQIGNGGAAGSITGDVANSGTLVFDRSDDVDFGGVVSGSGALTQQGSGSLTLTGSNSYTGGTTISAGTLQIGNGGTAGSITGDVANDGVLVFDRSDDVDFGGVVSGSGALTQQGSGTLTLTGANSYAGGTTIAAGSLQVGDGGTSGSITGNVANSGGLVFDRSDDVSFGGVVSGSGSLTQQGSGTLTLTGANTYGGGTTIAAGTLQVGNSGTAGSITGDVANSGTLVFDRSDAVGFGGVVSGSGSLTQQGSGTLTLTGANTYDGGTTIAAGTLQIGNGGAAGSITGDVANGGTLVFDRSDDVDFGGVVSGNGALTQQGNGSLTLTGSNSYTGGTTIAAGTLQIGNGGTAGSITGDVANSGTLVFDRSDDVSFGGVVSGSGALMQNGSGSLTLTGTNTYGGGTTIAGGTLQIGDGGTSGSIVGNVVNSGTLVFDRSDAVSFDGGISGTGMLVQAGSDTLTLDGASGAFAGSAQVRSGALIVGGTAGNGAVLGGDVDVDNSATLGGHGRIGGNVTLTGGAHLAPGASIGTLTVDGNLTLNAGSVLDFEFGAPLADFQAFGSSDSVMVGGDLTLGGSTLNVADVGGMGPGLYNVFTWGGTLNDNGAGITLGATPTGAALQIQTLAAQKQINLLDATSVTLNIWNANGKADATRMGGGDGTWSASSAMWTDASGIAPNAPMQPQPGFALFGGDAGTVSVDDGAGAVTATGLQFAVDGYRLTGNALTLVQDANGNAPVIRVGNGSAAGAATSATIDAVLAGTDGLVKADHGTLVLTGANTFSGGVTVNGGTLSVADDAHLGDASNTLTLDGGVLEVTGTAFTSTDRGIVLGDASGGFAIGEADTTFTVVSSLDGKGGLTKSGAGTLALTGSNTYTGGTTISAGTLQLGNGGTVGSITGDVANSGTLVFDRSDDVDFGGVVSGSGALTQQGAGTLTLTGSNSYAGGTTITGGSLQVGDGGTAGSITGDVANEGALVFDRSDDVDFGGVVSGSGAFTQQGSGSLTLTGSNTYTGGTTISAGSLQVGNGGTVGSITGDVANNGTLVFNRSDDVGFGGVVSGSGALTKQGDGKLTLTGSNTYAGGTTISAGSLQVGNGGKLGSITGDVANEGMLVFNRSDDVGFAGVVSGSGALTQQGDGKLTLTGSNSYAGGTTIAGGSLQVGKGGTAGSITGDVANEGELVFDRSDAVSFGGVVSGAGSFTQQGKGMLTLTGAGSWAGGTTIATGGLRIGDGGTAGSIVGDVANNGTLVFDRSDAVSFGGVVSGSGALVQNGSGSLTLTGANTYAGGTTIAAGTLVGDTHSLQGAIANRGALVFAQAGDGSFDGSLSGSGSLSKTGQGELILNGDSHTFTGATSVQEGALIVGDDGFADASLGGTVTVGKHALLGGFGTVGGMDLAGTLATGHSIGTLHVAGDAIFQAGSTWQIEVDPDGRSDQLDVAGKASIKGGSALALGADGNWRAQTDYVVLDAAGGVDGEFDEISSNLAFLKPTLSYAANNVTLSLVRNQVDFDEVAHTPNQTGVAHGIEDLGPGHPVHDVIVGMDADQARGAFDQLSGEWYAGMQSARLDDSRYVREAMDQRLNQADTGAASASTASLGHTAGTIWFHGWGQWGDRDGDGNAARMQSNGSGMLVGVDADLDGRARIGGVLGASQSSIRVGERVSDGHDKATWAGVYGSATTGPVQWRAGLAYASERLDSHRHLTVRDLAGNVGANLDGSTEQGWIEAALPYTTGRGRIDPFLNLAHVRVHADGWSEGGGVTALQGGDSSARASLATLGVRGAWNLGSAELPIQLHGSLGWRQAFGTDTPEMRMSLDGSAPFTVYGLPLARHAIAVQAGLDFAISGKVSVDLGYSGQFAGDARDQGARVTVRIGL